MKTDLPVWPLALMEDALFRLGGQATRQRTFHVIADSILTPREMQTWLYAAAARGELDVDAVHVPGADLERAVRASAPLLVVVSWGVLALEKVSGQRATLLTPDGGKVRVPVAAVCDAVRALWEKKYELDTLDALVEGANVASGRKAAVRASLQKIQLAARDIELGWAVRPASNASLFTQLRRSGQLRTVGRVALALIGAEGAALAGWYLLGKGALNGLFDRGWLGAWALALLSAAVLRVACSFWEGLTSIAIGALLKKRLLLGALRLDPNAMRKEGLGRAMGRVLEAETLEELSLAGGFLTIVAGVELVIAMVMLARTNTTVFGALLVAVLLMLGASGVHYRRTKLWTNARLGITHDLVERLVGHRTRVAQGDQARVQDDEDVALASYAGTSRALDRLASAAGALLPRAALIVGIVALVPTFLASAAPGSKATVDLWVAVGGIILAQRALGRLGNGISSLFEAAVAWKSAAPLFEAARTAEEAATELGLMASLRTTPPGETLLETRHVEFRFAPDRQPVVRDATIRVQAGDQLLLEGASGSGKSTMVSLFSGLRLPQSGLVLFGGLDRHALGAAVWRKKVSATPQYHENHILQGTLAFNLLLGREWPASPDDLEEAEAICLELGLGDLLDRMPSRLMQTVGSTGWRLSHGEQSRVFIARALLQRSELTILDESLAALDPETLDTVMQCVRRRAGALVLVAHP